MRRSARVSGSAIVWADRRRLQHFYCKGRLLPFLTQAPDVAVMTTVRSVVSGQALFVGDVGSSRKRQSGGLMSSMTRSDAEQVLADRSIIVDAAACFLTPATIRRMLQKLATVDVVSLSGNGAALAMRSPVLAWLRQNIAGHSVVDLIDLYHFLRREGRSGHWRFATLSAVGAEEQPLLNIADLYAGVCGARVAVALRLIQRGLGLRDPDRIDIRGTLTFGRNVFIDINVIIIGEVILEDGVTVGPNCILENVRIKAGSTIKEFSLLAGAIVGSTCRVGPFARIRPGTVLGRGCHIGNYVEMKNATLGRNCKINHHSFVGDAVLGHDVIMGAGSMTCNFDGTKSNVTTIRNKAFIGSGVMLVAPVVVERNAFVGAGSTLVTNAPAHSLTLGRAKQVSIKGWKRK